MRKFAPKLHETALAWNRKDNFRMRHERAPGEKLSDLSSSSSESSSDSESDQAADLDAAGLKDAVEPGLALGARAFKLQGNSGTNSGLSRTAIDPHRSRYSHCDAADDGDASASECENG